MKLFYETRPSGFFMGVMCPVAYPLHVHSVCEIVHLLKGHAKISVDEKGYELNPGDTVVVFPSVPHSYDMVSEDSEGLCLMFAPDTINEFAARFKTLQPVSPLLAASDVPSALGACAEKALELSKDPDNYLLTAYLHLILAHIFAVLPLKPSESNPDADLPRRILQYVREHYKEPLTLESVSAAMGICKTYLSKLFSNNLRVSFRDYINALRVDEACALLRKSDLTITQIAYACGFNNLRTFHRAFIDITRLQPKEYRAHCAGKTASE